VTSAAGEAGAGPTLEVTDSRTATVGTAHVRRALPTRGRRTVGAWCFVDHAGPMRFDAGERPDIGPHPHMGIHTVTWLIDGEMLHRDSLGSEQVLRPGQLNLMTAGRGVAHAEEATSPSSQTAHLVQLWVAQPSATRAGSPAFEHHAELPRLDLGDAVATVLIGDLGGASSPARRDSDMVGVDLDLRPGRTVVPLDPAFEHALVVTGGEVLVDDRVLTPGHLAYLGNRREELVAAASEPARVLLLGGVPFPEPLLMWWNLVARTREEIEAGYLDWATDSGRFGRVASPLARVETKPPVWMPAHA
jgi:redox-sensitive bicupin YhaK (pirin superfamily)